MLWFSLLSLFTIHLSAAPADIPEGMAADLRQMGFSRPERLIEKFPRVLGWSVQQDIAPKLEGLSQIGFRDPVKMAEMNPALLAMSLEKNIKPTVRHLVDDWQFSLRAIEGDPALIGVSLKRSQVLFALLKDLGLEPDRFRNGFKVRSVRMLSATDVLSNIRHHGLTEVTDEDLELILKKAPKCSSLFEL